MPFWMVLSASCNNFHNLKVLCVHLPAWHGCICRAPWAADRGTVSPGPKGHLGEGVQNRRRPVPSIVFPLSIRQLSRGAHQLSGCLGLSKPLIKTAKIFKKSFLQIFSSFIFLSVLKGSLKICKGGRSPSPAPLLPQSVIKNAAPPNRSFPASPIGSGACGQEFRSALLACLPCKNRSLMGDAGSW